MSNQDKNGIDDAFPFEECASGRFNDLSSSLDASLKSSSSEVSVDRRSSFIVATENDWGLKRKKTVEKSNYYKD